VLRPLLLLLLFIPSLAPRSAGASPQRACSPEELKRVVLENLIHETASGNVEITGIQLSSRQVKYLEPASSAPVNEVFFTYEQKLRVQGFEDSPGTSMAGIAVSSTRGGCPVTRFQTLGVYPVNPVHP
jgi:hypothetical protein